MVTDLVANPQHPFSARLQRRAQAVRSWLCVGLDPLIGALPSGVSRDPGGVSQFCRKIVDSTAERALCYKVNFAFFETLGPDGFRTLDDVRRHIPADIPVIADAKRGDIPSTMAAYARAIFDVLDFDAVTLNPYLGWDALEPFLQYAGRGVFVLARTSNPGATWMQDLSVDGEPLYLHVSRAAATLDSPADVGVVAGATDLESLRRVRSLSEHLLVLVPGAGAQGASARDAYLAGSNAAGANALITMSRSIIHASTEADFEDRAAAAAREAAEATWGRPGP